MPQKELSRSLPLRVTQHRRSRFSQPRVEVPRLITFEEYSKQQESIVLVEPIRVAKAPNLPVNSSLLMERNKRTRDLQSLWGFFKQAKNRVLTLKFKNVEQKPHSMHLTTIY